MAYGGPGGMNTNILGLEAAGNLMVSYGRNLGADAFPVNRYAKVTPVKIKTGPYLQFDPLSIARFVNLPYSTHWAPGSIRPTGFDNKLGFQEQVFRCSRENFGTTLDKEAIDVANWPMLKAHTEQLAQRAMTWKTWRVTQKLFDSTQYAASHVVTATTASGTGFLHQGTTADPRVKNAWDYCARLIAQDTTGAIRFGNLTVLMNAVTALRLSSSREFREYRMQASDSHEMLTLKNGTGFNARYGLPDYLYGYKIIVDDVYYNTYNQNATGAVATPVVPDNKMIVLLAEPGDIERPDAMAPSYSTCHVFAYEELTVETYDDVRNRLTYLDVVMNIDVQIVAPPTAVIITNVFS